MDKALLARRLKIMEIAFMALAAVALIGESLPGLFAVLFLLGLQATLFGPVKYSLLPAHLAEHELVLGNALVEGATFMAILIGSILGGSLVGVSGGLSTIAVGLVALPASAISPRATSRRRRPLIPISLSPSTSSPTRSRCSARRTRYRPVWLCILGISWFWTFGATVLALVPALARDVLGGSESLASFFLAVFSVGIAVGSLACARRLRGEITPVPVPFAALAMSALLLVFAALWRACPLPR